MLGYWGQFKNMPHNTLNDLFKFKPMLGADKITLTEVEYVTTDKLAPDFTLHIHGYVGSTLTAPVDTQSVKTFDERFSTIISQGDFCVILLTLKITRVFKLQT